MIEKLKKVWYALTTIFVLLQTALTFYFLYLSAEEYRVIKIAVIVLALVYMVAFLILAIMSAHAKKYSPEAMGTFKKSRKAIKRFINLVILSLNVIYIINMGGVVKLYPIAMLVFNVLLILFDVKMAEIGDKIERHKKKKERAKKEREVSANLVENREIETNYNKHKKRHFFGDFSNK